MDRLDVTYQRAFMATPKDKYYNALLDTLVKENNLRGVPLSNKNIQESVSDVIEKRNHNSNVITIKSRAIIHISLRY